MSLSTSEKVVSMLKKIARKNDATGYYAARILCDILPNLAELDGVDATTASNELKETKAGIDLTKEGRLLSKAPTKLKRDLPHTGVGGGIRRTTVPLGGIGSYSQYPCQLNQRHRCLN